MLPDPAGRSARGPVAFACDVSRLHGAAPCATLVGPWRFPRPSPSRGCRGAARPSRRALDVRSPRVAPGTARRRSRTGPSCHSRASHLGPDAPASAVGPRAASRYPEAGGPRPGPLVRSDCLRRSWRRSVQSPNYALLSTPPRSPVATARLAPPPTRPSGSRGSLPAAPAVRSGPELPGPRTAASSPLDEASAPAPEDQLAIDTLLDRHRPTESPFGDLAGWTPIRGGGRAGPLRVLALEPSAGAARARLGDCSADLRIPARRCESIAIEAEDLIPGSTTEVLEGADLWRTEPRSPRPPPRTDFEEAPSDRPAPFAPSPEPAGFRASNDEELIVEEELPPRTLGTVSDRP